MDPLSTLGLACNIIQCVQFVGKIVSYSKDVYQSTKGLSEDAASLGEIAEHLSTIHVEITNRSLRQSISELSLAEKKLQNLLEETQKVTTDVLHTLQRLQIQGKRSVWGSVKHALQSAWHEDDIRKLENDLDNIRKQLDTTLLICIW